MRGNVGNTRSMSQKSLNRRCMVEKGLGPGKYVTRVYISKEWVGIVSIDTKSRVFAGKYFFRRGLMRHGQ